MWEIPLKELGDRCRVWEHSMPDAVMGPALTENIETICGIKVKIPSGLPLIFTKENKRLEIDARMNAEKIFFFGHVTFIDGYPVYGSGGAEVGRYKLIYSDGTEKETVLRNGIEFASSIMLSDVSRINPLAAGIRRILKITVDPQWEVFRVICLFLILFPNTDINQSIDITERLRICIIKNKYGTKDNVTCSFGLVSLKKNENAESLLQRADKHLYNAKRQGKNCISY